MAGGSTGKARFFTLRQCPDCMCDLPHRRELPNVFFAENQRIPEIGIMIRKYFPSDRPHPLRPYQGLARKAASACGPGPARPVIEAVRARPDFRCETGQWQHFNGSDSAPKDTKPKGF